jgi:hypothetical protein
MGQTNCNKNMSANLGIMISPGPGPPNSVVRDDLVTTYVPGEETDAEVRWRRQDSPAELRIRCGAPAVLPDGSMRWLYLELAGGSRFMECIQEFITQSRTVQIFPSLPFFFGKGRDFIQ